VRRTEQRAVILDELRKCRNHPGADELYARVRGRLPRISLATVYRNLELMAADGLIRRLDPGCGSRRFDPVVDNHGHFRCTSCGRVEDLPFPLELPRPDGRHPWVRRRTIQGGQAEYFGLCPGCRRTEAKGGADRLKKTLVPGGRA
jgi:Fur family ferric uptake transcriptional regulator